MTYVHCCVQGLLFYSNYLRPFQHPGGNEDIIEYGGRNCTRDFDDAGHSETAM